MSKCASTHVFLHHAQMDPESLQMSLMPVLLDWKVWQVEQRRERFRGSDAHEHSRNALGHGRDEIGVLDPTQPAILVVANKLGVPDAKGLIGLLQKNPGKYSFASVGAGSISHLAMEALSARIGADLVHAAFAGSSAAALAVITGEVDMALLPAAAVMPQIKAGKMKGLAVAAGRRSALLPELPTLAEAGVDDLRADAWIGFIVHVKTPNTTSSLIERGKA